MGATIFPEQISVGELVVNAIYASGVVGAIMILAGLLLIDSGGVRRRNIFTTTTEKLVGFFIGFTMYFLIGFAIWSWQFYEAADPSLGSWGSLVAATKDFWMGGTLTGAKAQFVDPAIFPALNSFQIVLFFLACFAGIVNVLFHLGVQEKLRASGYYATCVVMGVVSSYVSYVTYGSAGPLTNLGYHDFFGVGFVYMFPALVAIPFVIALRSRPGMFEPHPKVAEYRFVNTGLVTTGIMLVFGGLVMAVLACIFFFDFQGSLLAVSLTMADTSVGVALNNFALAWAGGVLMGAVIAYKTRNLWFIWLGPIAGYVANSSALDIYAPWQAFLVALGGPVVAFLIYSWLHKRHVDEHKLFPVFLGSGIYGLLALGFIKWGLPRGGYYGIEDGTFAFQNNVVTPWWQLTGIVFVIVVGLTTGLVMVLLLKAIGRLEVDPDVQADGLDVAYWDTEPDVQPLGEHPSAVGGGTARHEAGSATAVH